MALKYHPTPGEILLCDYRGGVVPEMVKRRPAVIMSPRLRRRNDLVLVVPLSTTAPTSIEAYHCRLELAPTLPPPFDSAVVWAKCDMLATVALARLDRFRSGHGAQGRRYVSGQVSSAQFALLRAAMLHGLGLGILTKWLSEAI